jgi:putative membrane protein
MRFIIKIILSSFSVFAAGWLLEGVYINNYGTSILVALVLAVLDYVIKPILIFLTIPITVFTFGLFLLVINAWIPLMASGLIPGFYIVNFWWALAFSLIVSVLNYLINVK